MPEIPDFSEETESTEGSEALGDDAADSTMPGDTEMAAGKTDDFSFDMPDFDADEFDVSTDESKERQTEEKPTDIGSVPETSAEQTAESEDNFADFGDFNLEDSDLNFDSAEDKENDFVKSPSAAKENPPLYDLNLPDDIDENAGKKKCRIPMLICIICALLCILAVIGIFLRLPWKNRGGTQNADANIVTVEPPDQKEQPKDAVPPAPEENTIVIVEQEKVEKQEVIPEKTEPAPEVKPQTVRYLIKWGDTLWDLSDTYYRNPWLYPIIARENKIKNPDLIIAGTYINIPPR
ncbi:LysM peptidoglycan-binding domain-containing protein [Treponema maltophilum]